MYTTGFPRFPVVCPLNPLACPRTSHTANREYMVLTPPQSETKGNTMTQTFDFAPIKASETSLKPLPWGRYAAAIESLEIVTSKTGKEMVQITTSLLGPKQFEGALLENKKLWFYIILGNEKTSEKFAKVAAACNIAQTEFTDNDIHETVKNGILEGSTVSVQINTELFEGEKVNKICAFYTIESMLALKN